MPVSVPAFFEERRQERRRCNLKGRSTNAARTLNALSLSPSDSFEKHSEALTLVLVHHSTKPARPSRYARKSGSLSRFCDSGPRRTQLVRMASCPSSFRCRMERCTIVACGYRVDWCSSLPRLKCFLWRLQPRTRIRHRLTPRPTFSGHGNVPAAPPSC